MDFNSVEFVDINGKKYDCEKKENTIFIYLKDKIKTIKDIPIFVKQSYDYFAFTEYWNEEKKQYEPFYSNVKNIDLLFHRITWNNNKVFLLNKTKPDLLTYTDDTCKKKYPDIFEKDINPYTVPIKLIMNNNNEQQTINIRFDKKTNINEECPIKIKILLVKQSIT